MKNIKKILITLLTLASIYGIGRLTVVLYDSYVLLERQPYTQLQTKHSILIKYNSLTSEKGCVNLLDFNRTICEKESQTEHSIFIDNLEEGKTYRYRVNSESLKIDNNNRTFSTLSSDTNRTEYILVFGDSGEKADKALNKLNVYHQALNYLQEKTEQARSLNHWLLLGDNAYRSGSQKQFNETFFEPYSELFKYITPWMVNGNHDARRFAFYDMFDFPTKAECGGLPSDSKYYYAIESANLHMVILDSQSGDTDADSKMAEWLVKDLAKNKKTWTIVAFHHPPYTDGSHKSDNHFDSGGRMERVRENLLPIFEKYGVDLVLSGHAHGYERSKLIHKHYGKSNTFNKELHIVQNNDHNYSKNLYKHPYDGTIYNVMGSSSKANSGDYNHPALPFSYALMGSLLLSIDAHNLKGEFITDKGKKQDYFNIKK